MLGYEVMSRLEWDAGDGIGFGDLFEVGDQRFHFGDDGLHGAQGERGVVAGFTFPDLGDPQDVFVGCVAGDDITEAAGHVGGAFSEESDDFIALAGKEGELCDQTVHGLKF